MSNEKVKRKVLNLSIEKTLQVRLIIKVLLITFLSILIVGGGFYFYTDQRIGETYESAHIKMDTFRAYLFPIILIFAALAASITFLLTLFLPGKIAGPLYRTKKEMERLGNGDLRTILAFRQGDELKDLAAAFNLMVENLNSKLRPVLEHIEQIISTSEELCRLAEEGKSADIREQTRIQLERVKQLRAILEQFRWKDN